VIEVIHPGTTAVNAKAVIFDFDGTLSLIRSGWMDVMLPMCVEQLKALGTNESPEELGEVVEEFVWRLTGKETIYQMMALADAIRARGGCPIAPLEYKKMYLDRLWVNIRDRVEGLRSGSLQPERFLVPGAMSLLETLSNRGLELYLASGTDDANVKEEAGLLGITRFFEERIYGAQDDLKSFSKALLVQRILSETAIKRGDELLVFGDGFVEIEEVAKAGGVAVGVASSEPDCVTVDSWKRERLIRAGADFIVPNFLQLMELTGAVLENAALAETH
jgi:phosphoglycolate phosphatase-like HAD superfamily hydrolase